MTRRTQFGFLAVIAALVVLLPAGLAGAQDNPYTDPKPTIAGEAVVLDPADPPSEPAAAAGESLAFTGGDIAALLVLGVVLVGGGALVLVGRNRATAAA